MGTIFNRLTLKQKKKELRSNMTKTEWIIWSHLRNKQLGVKFRRQHPIGRFIVDFYCPEKLLAIEIDGDSHFLSADTISNDTKRDAWINGLRVQMLRFTNLEVKYDLERVLEKIRSMI